MPDIVCISVEDSRISKSLKLRAVMKFYVKELINALILAFRGKRL